MRFNLNNRTSLLFGYRGERQAAEVTEQARFYAEACLAFCRDHDMEYHPRVHSYLHSPDGAATMAGWLSGKGWRVEPWCVKEEIGDPQIDDPLAWGLNFDNTCPRFTEARLNGWRYKE